MSPVATHSVASDALPQRDPTVTVSALVDLFMRAYAGRDSSRPQRLRWWQEQCGKLILADLNDNPDPIAHALDQLANRHGMYYGGTDATGHQILRPRPKPISGATINRYAAALAATLKWATKKRITPKGWINPMREVEQRKENPGNVRFLSDDECERLLDACKASKFDRLYLLVLMALTTGARKGELLGLRWRDIDMERAKAALYRTKNDTPRMLPLPPDLVEELRRFEVREANGQPSNDLVFASTRFPDKPYWFRTSWEVALEAANIKNFRFHDLRHSCASYLAMAGENVLMIAEILGHKNLATTRRYAHLSIESKRATVVRVLGKVGRKK